MTRTKRFMDMAKYHTGGGCRETHCRILVMLAVGPIKAIHGRLVFSP